MTEIHDIYETAFRADVLAESPPSSEREVFFRHKDHLHQRDGMIVRVTSPERWVGYFSRGETNFSDIIVQPSGVVAVVISNGAAYVVPLKEPQAYSSIMTPYVKGAIPTSSGVTVLYDQWSLAGVRDRELMWICNLGADGYRGLVDMGIAVQVEAYLPNVARFVVIRFDPLAGPPPGEDWTVVS